MFAYIFPRHFLWSLLVNVWCLYAPNDLAVVFVYLFSLSLLLTTNNSIIITLKNSVMTIFVVGVCICCTLLFYVFFSFVRVRPDRWWSLVLFFHSYVLWRHLPAIFICIFFVCTFWYKRRVATLFCVTFLIADNFGPKLQIFV